VFAPIAQRPAAIPRYLQARLDPADRRVIGRPGVRRVLADTFTEGLRNGPPRSPRTGRCSSVPGGSR
jgi:hypothetical protein